MPRHAAAGQQLQGAAAATPRMPLGPLARADTISAGAAAVEAAGCARIEPALAAAFTGVLDVALREAGAAPEEQLQRERFKLFDQGAAAPS